eukprot:2254525-Rhodomonas_salina.2
MQRWLAARSLGGLRHRASVWCYQLAVRYFDSVWIDQCAVLRKRMDGPVCGTETAYGPPSR